MDLLEKFRLGSLAALHALANKTIDLNSIGAVRQQVRDLENNIKDLKNDLAEADGHAVTARDDRDALTEKAADLQRDIDTLLLDEDDSNDSSALILQRELNDLRGEITAAQEETEASALAAKELREAVVLNDSQLASFKSQLSQLSSLHRTARSKARSASTLVKAKELLGDGVDSGIDSIARQIRESANVADAKFAQAVSDVHSEASQDVAISQASADLARRKKELAARIVENSSAVEPAES